VVVLDTNMLMLAARRGFPFEAEIDRLVPGARLVVPSSAVRELDVLIARRTAGSRAAREIAGHLGIESTPRSGDAGVVDLAERTQGLVATADRELQRRLMERGVGVLAPRDRAHLELRWPAVLDLNPDGRKAVSSRKTRRSTTSSLDEPASRSNLPKE
jgi:rRNA-processing protein FCF1